MRNFDHNMESGLFKNTHNQEQNKKIDTNHKQLVCLLEGH